MLQDWYLRNVRTCLMRCEMVWCEDVKVTISYVNDVMRCDVMWTENNSTNKKSSVAILAKFLISSLGGRCCLSVWYRDILLRCRARALRAIGLARPLLPHGRFGRSCALWSRLLRGCEMSQRHGWPILGCSIPLTPLCWRRLHRSASTRNGSANCRESSWRQVWWRRTSSIWQSCSRRSTPSAGMTWSGTTTSCFLRWHMFWRQHMFQTLKRLMCQMVVIMSMKRYGRKQSYSSSSGTSSVVWPSTASAENEPSK